MSQNTKLELIKKEYFKILRDCKNLRLQSTDTHNECIVKILSNTLELKKFNKQNGTNFNLSFEDIL